MGKGEDRHRIDVNMFIRLEQRTSVGKIVMKTRSIQQLGQKIWQNEQGVLSFEWVLLITVLVIGIVGALSAVRDSIIDELGDMAGATVAIDQSYTVTFCEACIPPNTPECFRVTGRSFSFADTIPQCNGQPVPVRQRPTTPIVDQGDVQPCKK